MTFKFDKEELISRIQDAFGKVVRASMNSEKASDYAKDIREKYTGFPNDMLADVMIRRAALYTRWEGAVNGLGVTGCEIAVAAPAPEPSHKAAAAGGAVALLVGDMAYTTRVQMQLVLSIGDIYGCPYDPDDEEDVWTIFKAALGVKGLERVGTYSRFVAVETARKQFRKLLRLGIRKSVQERIVKIAGPKVGRFLGEKYVMRLLPLLNAYIGYEFNKRTTKSVGKWSKVKAKIRSSAFRQVERITDDESEALLLVLPTMFYVGTLDDNLTDNFLTLYSQTRKRLKLDEEQLHRVESIMDDEDIYGVLKREFANGYRETTRKSLFDIALTTAAVNLSPHNQQEDCLDDFAKCLGIEWNPSDLREKLRYFSC